MADFYRPPPAEIGAECVKTLRQNWSLRVYAKSENYRLLSRSGFCVETRFSVQPWAPIALKNVFTQHRPKAAVRDKLLTTQSTNMKRLRSITVT